MTLREVLHAHLPVLGSHSTLRDAVDKMDVYQFPALVVEDADHCPIGILTEGDICRAVSQQGALLSLANESAAKFATPDPVTASPDMEVSEALHLMLSRGITALPVVEDLRLSGLVLRVDLMQAMLLDASSS